MEEDFKLACRIHLGVLSSDSDSDHCKDKLDEIYKKYQPPPYDYNSLNIIKVPPKEPLTEHKENILPPSKIIKRKTRKQKAKVKAMPPFPASQIDEFPYRTSALPELDNTNPIYDSLFPPLNAVYSKSSKNFQYNSLKSQKNKTRKKTFMHIEEMTLASYIPTFFNKDKLTSDCLDTKKQSFEKLSLGDTSVDLASKEIIHESLHVPQKEVHQNVAEPNFPVVEKQSLTKKKKNKKKKKTGVTANPVVAKPNNYQTGRNSTVSVKSETSVSRRTTHNKQSSHASGNFTEKIIIEPTVDLAIQHKVIGNVYIPPVYPDVKKYIWEYKDCLLNISGPTMDLSQDKSLQKRDRKQIRKACKNIGVPKIITNSELLLRALVKPSGDKIEVTQKVSFMSDIEKLTKNYAQELMHDFYSYYSGEDFENFFKFKDKYLNGELKILETLTNFERQVKNFWEDLRNDFYSYYSGDDLESFLEFRDEYLNENVGKPIAEIQISVPGHSEGRIDVVNPIHLEHRTANNFCSYYVGKNLNLKNNRNFESKGNLLPSKKPDYIREDLSFSGYYSGKNFENYLKTNPLTLPSNKPLNSINIYAPLKYYRVESTRNTLNFKTSNRKKRLHFASLPRIDPPLNTEVGPKCETVFKSEPNENESFIKHIIENDILAKCFDEVAVRKKSPVVHLIMSFVLFILCLDLSVEFSFFLLNNFFKIFTVFMILYFKYF